MNPITHLLHALTLLALASAATAEPGADTDTGMTALSDSDMADVDARAGISLDLEFRINAQANGDPLSCPAVGSASSCRIALNFAERNGIWIIMKDYRGIIHLNNVWVDASNLLPNWTTHTSNGSVQNPALAGFDPRNKPAIQLSAGNWANALAGGSSVYNTYLNSNGYNEFTTALNIASLSGEYNCGNAVDNANGLHTGGCSSASAGWDDSYTPDSLDHVPGYLRNAVSGAAISLRMADGVSNANAPMQIRLDGRLQMAGY